MSRNTKNPSGRPSKYSQELALHICEEMASGKSLRQLCRQEGMPALATIFVWLHQHPDFANNYMRAREILIEHWAEEILDIADDGTNDWVQTNDPDNPGYRANGEHINRARLRIDSRKWLLAKLAPRKYGDRQQVEHSGGVVLQSKEQADALLQSLGLDPNVIWKALN